MEVKRPAILFLGAFILGIIIAYNPIPFLCKLIIGFIAIFLYLRLVYLGKLKVRVLLLIFLFLILGFYRFKTVENIYDTYTANVLEIGKGEKFITGKVKSIGKSTNSNYIVLENCSSSGLNLGTARVYCDDQIITDIKIGNSISIKAGTSVIEEPSNEGEFNQKNYYRSNGISFIAFAKEINITNGNYDILKQKIYEIKNVIKENIDKSFDDKDAGLFLAMLTGDRSRIDKTQKNTFSENGIAHIIAISGLHLSILGLMLFELLRKLMPLNVSAAFTGIFIFLYGIFIDASATTLRAISMLYIRFLSLAIGRTYDSKNTLYIICFVFLCMSPYLIFNAGFQFSYVAIYALNSEVYIRGRENIKIPAIITLNIFLFPITIYHYFTYPLYSIFLNLIVIPLMPFVLGFGILGLSVSFIYLPFAILITRIIHVIFMIYDALCMFIEKLPYHILWLGRPTLYEILYYYIVIFLIIYVIENLNVIPRLKKSVSCNIEKIKEIKYRILSYKVVNAIRLSISILLLFMTALIIGIRTKNDLRMTFISIGQGDSILIEARDLILTIDGGSSSNNSNGEYILVPHMKSRSINHIDYAFVTHADSDHTNGLMHIFENEDEIQISNLILPINAKIDTKFDKLKSAASVKGTRVAYMMEKDILKINDDMKINVLSPDFESLDHNKMDQNELSLTFRFDYKNHSCLFTGDIGKLTMNRMIGDDYANKYLPVEVLKIPHHGSKNSNVKEFFDLVYPKISVVSYGKNNNYGHPNTDMINNILETGSKVLKTGESGQIDIYFDKEMAYYKTFR